MAVRSAGILLYRRKGQGHKTHDIELFLVHPGGPFWAKKDIGAWSIPKGELDEGEETAAAARREFAEETGIAIDAPLTDLGAFRQPSGKTVLAFAAEGDCDPLRVVSNTFEMEWPPKSGRKASFPEIDRAAWFSPAEAIARLTTGQKPIVAALLKHLTKA